MIHSGISDGLQRSQGWYSMHPIGSQSQAGLASAWLSAGARPSLEFITCTLRYPDPILTSAD